MVEASNQLKILPASILDMYKVFGHIDTVSIGIVIGHGIGGKVIPAKMARQAKSQLLE
jgi:hypothetical protein